MPEISRNRQNARYAEDVVNVKDFDGVDLTGATSSASAMDAALATGARVIHVPDNIMLGQHTISSSVTLVGGDSVSFDPTVAAAGFLIGSVDYVKISGFTNCTLDTYPDTGGVIADGHTFAILAPGAVVGKMIIEGNEITGGKVGIAANFENGRTLEDTCIIRDNICKNQNGGLGGEGYGIQFANENDTGTAYIEGNVIHEAGRHAVYVARNNGGGSVHVNNNVSFNHRENSTTHGNVRAAIQITRAKNVYASGNVVDGYYDCALYIEGEEEIALGIDAVNVVVKDTTIRRPKNTLSAIRVGYLGSTNNARNIGVVVDGVYFYSTNIASCIEYSYGEFVSFKNITCHYDGVTSGTARAVILEGDTTANSNNILVENLDVFAENCAGLTLYALRPTTFLCTNNTRLDIRNVKMESDATTTGQWNPQSVITNTEIAVNGAEWPVASTSVAKQIDSPSIARLLTASTTYDPASIADGDEVATNVTVTGAELGDFAIPSFSVNTQSLTLSASVVASDTVTVVFANNTGSPVDLASGTLSLLVLKAIA